MRYFFPEKAVLKWLETPSVYHLGTDELYELDDASFDYLNKCASGQGCTGADREFIDFCLREGILTREGPTRRHPPLIKSPVPSLRYLELQITDRCNLRCRHCYIEKKTDSTYAAGGGVSGNELSPDEIRHILAEFEELQGLRLMITGGEPLLHTGFEAVNEMLPAFFVRKVLFTNGLLLKKELLCRLNVDEIQISIDGLEQGHDALRGSGTFGRAVHAVRLAREQGFEVSVATMVHAKNLAEFEGMEKLFSELGIKDWTVDVPCITGRDEQASGFRVPPEVGGRYLRYGYGAGLHSGDKGFGCGPHLLSVTADGKVTKCTFYSDRSAGTLSEGLRRCREKNAPVLLKDLACDCAHLEACRGGCRYRAELLGDPLGKDLYKCFSYDILGTE